MYIVFYKNEILYPKKRLNIILFYTFFYNFAKKNVICNYISFLKTNL